MATGEGKTLVATSRVPNAISGRGVHVVTVNDYLAQRDSGVDGPMPYRFLGLTVRASPTISPRRSGAKCTGATSPTAPTEFGFDYLRDNGMASNREETRFEDTISRSWTEVDSILIDEARRP